MAEVKKEYKKVKFLTNMATPVTFKYDTPREFEGEYGKSYSYGVEYKGEDAYMSVTPMLNDMLQKLGPLQGKSLEILKYQDPDSDDLKKVFWKILDASGNDITPAVGSAPSPEQKPATAQNLASGEGAMTIAELTAGFKAMKKWAERVEKELSSLRMELQGHSTLLVDLRGENAVDLHTSFPETDPKNPEEKPKEPPLGKEYNDIPTVNP